jgi:hypothetical protein
MVVALPADSMAADFTVVDFMAAASDAGWPSAGSAPG